MKHARIELSDRQMGAADMDTALELIDALADAVAHPECVTSWERRPEAFGNWYQVSGPDDVVERFKQAAMAVVNA